MATPARSKVITWIGRASAVGAVMFGLLVGTNLVVGLGPSGDVQMLEGLLVGGSALLTIGGGAAYLVGLDRIRGPRGRSMRIGGWMLYAAGLLLPTSLVLFQLAAIAGGGPAAFARVEQQLADDV
ncbi:MAG: hypothetical protein WD990_10190 [Acidimicrobiia bacterium]